MASQKPVAAGVGPSTASFTQACSALSWAMVAQSFAATQAAVVATRSARKRGNRAALAFVQALVHVCRSRVVSQVVTRAQKVEQRSCADMGGAGAASTPGMPASASPSASG